MSSNGKSEAVWAAEALKLRSGLKKIESESDELVQLLASGNRFSEARAKTKIRHILENSIYKEIDAEHQEALQKARYFFARKS